MAEALAGRVWVKDDQHCWLLATVNSSTSRSVVVTVAMDGSSRKVAAADTKPVNATHLADPIWDIAQVSEMSEAPLIDVLRRRFIECKIYTMVSDILIAINPYYMIPGLYDLSGETRYELGETPPHIFTTADSMYRLMVADGRLADQAVLVSGESGAGKTEACKSIMNYLAQLSKKVVAERQRRGSAVDDSATSTIETKVLACNPFLEAFGNAKTCRNDNSSRFGKFLKIHYTRGSIVGAKMDQYLLEKGRLTNQGPGERNYHIYYQLCKGLGREERAQLGLKSAKEYRILTVGGRDSVKCARIDDGAEFVEARAAMIEVGIRRDEEQWTIFKVLTALLELGNARWIPTQECRDGAQPVGANRIACVENHDSVALAAKHLGVPMLEESLAIRILPKAGSICQAPLTAEKAHDATEALIKFTYKRVFAWLVKQINVLLKPEGKSESYIGILDIFGFEIFEVNSFEQLCINYTNEKLQALFNHHVFEIEQATYVEEGIDVDKIKFKDNKHCLLLVEGKTKVFIGILPRLDEKSRLERAADTDEAFANELAYFFKSDRGQRKRLEKELGSIKNGAATIRKYVAASEYIEFPKCIPNDWFAIHHFAGPVTYAVEGFLEKNKDRLYPHLQAAMGASSDPFVSALFTATPSTTKKSSRSPPSGRRRQKQSKDGGDGVNTIAGRFIAQLGALVDTVEKTNQHYVRCIKPNSQKLKCTRGIDAFEAQKCRQQLLYAGVMETIKIRKQGYPVRELYESFWAKALRNKWEVFAGVSPSSTAKEGTCAVVTAAVGDQDESGMWLSGNTMLFGKDGLMEEITRWHRRHVVRTIQRFARSRNVRVAMKRFIAEKNARKYAHMKGAIKIIEALAMGALARRDVTQMRGRFERERAEAERRRLAAESAAARAEDDRLALLQQQAEDVAVRVARLAAVAAHTIAANTTRELAGLLAYEAGRRALAVARAAAQAAARQARRAAIAEQYASKIRAQMLGAADSLADRARQFAANQRAANQSSKSLLYQQIDGLSASVSSFASNRPNLFESISAGPSFGGAAPSRSYGSPAYASPSVGYASPSAGYASTGPGYASTGPGYASTSPGYASRSVPGYASSPAAGYASPDASKSPVYGGGAASGSSPSYGGEGATYSQTYASPGNQKAAWSSPGSSPMPSTAAAAFEARQVAAANSAYQFQTQRGVSPPRRGPSAASSYFNLVPGVTSSRGAAAPPRVFPSAVSTPAFNRNSNYSDLIANATPAAAAAVAAVLQATAGEQRQVHVSRRGSVDVSLRR